MNYLLDTNVFLWLMQDEDKISMPAFKNISNADNQLLLSSISVWEIWQKYSLGKLNFTKNVKVMIDEVCNTYIINSLAFHATDCLHLHKLPPIHRDPCDRMLICQAIQNNLTIVTPDKDIRQYPIATLW